MAELKTLPNDASVEAFLAGVTDDARRADAQALCAIMAEVTATKPIMWGTSIVGFGAYSYHYGSGQKGEAAAVGLSPRKQNLTVYISCGFDRHADLLNRLGRHKLGRACLYLRRLSDVDEVLLRELIVDGFTQVNGRLLTPGEGW